MTKNDAKTDNVLFLQGELTVDRMADFKNELQQSLNSTDSLEIDLDQVTKVDLACLQLFCSAHRTAIRDGKKWCIRNMAGSVFQTAGEEAGFSYHTKCRFHPTVDCLWNGGDENG